MNILSQRRLQGRTYSAEGIMDGSEEKKPDAEERGSKEDRKSDAPVPPNAPRKPPPPPPPPPPTVESFANDVAEEEE